LYALIATLSSILGGLLPLYTKVKNIKNQYLIAFASGVLISTALFEILPEALLGIPDMNFALPLSMGFFSLYVVEKVAMIHACKETECDLHHAGWVGMIGLGLESLLDGIAIAIGYFTNPVLGVFIAFAVVVHELPVGFSTSVIMRTSGYAVNQSLVALVATSLLTVVGAVVSRVFPAQLFGQILAFTAGTFLYIGASDLLPEAHRSVNWTVVGTVLAGAALIPVIKAVIGI
ncbi:MAG: ZIP family metal transporter, partial [Candidatus Hydrothermarchaeales archaeon]